MITSSARQSAAQWHRYAGNGIEPDCRWHQDLSSSTEEQASSLEGTASSTEGLTSIAKQNADKACKANQLAVSASNVAVSGCSLARQVINIMELITDSSRKIVAIIAVNCRSSTWITHKKWKRQKPSSDATQLTASSYTSIRFDGLNYLNSRATVT